MKTVNRILKTIKIPFKLMSQVGSIPVKFVYSKQKKLIKIISPSNVKIVAVKISRAGKKIIVTFALIVSIISSSGVENQKMIESSCIFPAKMSIERVIGLPNGGAINHPWSPGAKYEANSTKTSSGKAQTAKRDFARRQAGKNPTSRQSGGGFFADAFTVEPKFPARQGRNRDGLLGRFSARPTPDPSNPGCAGGPRSITVLSQSKSSEQDSVREVTAHDGVKGRLTDKSTNHLTSKHGDVLGIDDPLPPNPNQKPTKYKQIRTRVNKENKEKFGDIVEEILKDPTTEPYPDVSMRGIKGHGYYTENYGESGFFVGIHTEGEFAGQIKKAQPISDQQLKTLQEENRMD